MTHHRLYDQVLIPLVWNDDENMWEVDIAELGHGPLSPGDHVHHDDRREADCPCEDDVSHDEAWGRAAAADLPTAEALAQMLGFAMVRATAPANADVDWRPASPSLVGMFKDAIQDRWPDAPLAARDALVRDLVAIASSCDENAHRRGMFDQRQAALAQDQT